MFIGLYVKYPVFLSDFNQIKFSQRIFEKSSNIKFYENTSNGNWVVPCGRADGGTDRHYETNSHFLKFCKCV
jgi:hypothetical protein